jgi:hypothetical protein
MPSCLLPTQDELEIDQPSSAPEVFAEVAHHAAKCVPGEFLVCWLLIAHTAIIGQLPVSQDGGKRNYVAHRR